MRLQHLNVVKETDDRNKIAKLKALGYQEIQGDQPSGQDKMEKKADKKTATKQAGAADRNAEARKEKEADDDVKQSEQVEAALKFEQ